MKILVFSTCLVELLHGKIRKSVEVILTRLGHEIVVAPGAGCCGQPAHNSGAVTEARGICRQWFEAVRRNSFDYVVVPSGSCAAMIRHHMEHHLPESDRATFRELADKTYELSEFLVDLLGVEDLGAAYEGKVAYHASCHLLRDLGVADAPLLLLRRVRGLELVKLPDAEECCGFGGMFCALFPEISEAMVADKAENLRESGADTLVMNDTGCLIHIAGYLQKHKSPIRVKHIVEILENQISR